MDRNIFLNTSRTVKSKPSPEALSLILGDLEAAEADVYIMAKSYFELVEYDRCSFFTQNAVSPKVQVGIMRIYILYLDSKLL
jgi:hypothetical protein